MADSVVDELRGQISDRDLAILLAVNERIELVVRLKRYKDEHGIEFVDPDREAAMLRALADANPGPLSDESARQLFLAILDLTKREVLRLEEAP